MGITFSSFIDLLYGKKEIRILMVGIGDAGKTTLLYKLKLGKIVTTIPTIGFNIETIKHKNIYFTIWDLAGSGDKGRALWFSFYSNSKAVIFVVDSADRQYIGDAERDLKCLLNNELLRDTVLLVLANKQDLPDAMTTAEVTEKLKLNELAQKWYIHPTSGIRGEGLYEGLDWLAKELAE